MKKKQKSFSVRGSAFADLITIKSFISSLNLRITPHYSSLWTSLDVNIVSLEEQ